MKNHHAHTEHTAETYETSYAYMNRKCYSFGSRHNQSCHFKCVLHEVEDNFPIIFRGYVQL